VRRNRQDLRCLTMAAPDRAELRRNRSCGAYASTLGQKAQRQARLAGEPDRWATSKGLHKVEEYDL
jgi:hypothetical protein